MSSLVLDGTDCGIARNVAGGAIVSDVVTEKIGPGHFAKKHLGGVRYEEFEMDVGFAMAKPLFDWIHETWQILYPRRSGSVLAFSDKREVKSERKFLNAVLTETTIPPLVASETSRTSQHTEVIRDKQRLWRSGLTPEIFGALLVQPERMGALNLSRYIRHLAENRQRTDRFEIAFWNKMLYPLAILVMMTLALPFAYLHVRSGTMSFKVFSGIMIGVIFYTMNKVFSHLGLLNTWPPIVVAALPGLVVLSAALTALYWVERR